MLKEWIGRAVLGDHRANTRRTAAFLFDRGRAWQPAEWSKRQHLAGLLVGRGHRVFVEAGTYRGDTVAALLPHVDSAISVELDRELYEQAAARFRDDPRVEIRFGDALAEIPAILAGLASPPLVYLDGHFSGPGTAHGDGAEPAAGILERLRAVAPAGTTVVVDDLRLFGVQRDFPGLDELVLSARTAFPHAAIRIGLDSLVIES